MPTRSGMGGRLPSIGAVCRAAAFLSMGLLLAGTGVASGYSRPIPAQQSQSKPVRHYGRIDAFGPTDSAERAAFEEASAAGSLRTLPTWSRRFSIGNKPYSYTLVGGPPGLGGRTVVPTVIVPIRLTISDFSEDGRTPVVLDAAEVVSHILASPLFQPAIAGGNRQFADAMLHAEFPKAPAHWRTTLSPSVAATLEIDVPPGAAKVFKSKSGKLLAVIEDGSVVNKPIAEAVKMSFSGSQLPIFVTYNALLRNAFGYHSFKFAQDKSEVRVYIYSSWLEHVNDALGEPAPDAVTLSHEIAEVVHDPLLTSVTRYWGDAFNHNRCFDKLIEVGDAVEDAPFKIQYYRMPGMLKGRQTVFTVQTEALLPWFERQSPSKARHRAYSFPGEGALTAPAPLNCER